MEKLSNKPGLTASGMPCLPPACALHADRASKYQDEVGINQQKSQQDVSELPSAMTRHSGNIFNPLKFFCFGPSFAPQVASLAHLGLEESLKFVAKKGTKKMDIKIFVFASQRRSNLSILMFLRT